MSLIYCVQCDTRADDNGEDGGHFSAEGYVCSSCEKRQDISQIFAALRAGGFKNAKLYLPRNYQ
jgi:hypothetical protein